MNYCFASKTFVYFYYKKSQQEKKQRLSKTSNLILVKNHAINT